MLAEGGLQGMYSSGKYRVYIFTHCCKNIPMLLYFGVHAENVLRNTYPIHSLIPNLSLELKLKWVAWAPPCAGLSRHAGLGERGYRLAEKAKVAGRVVVRLERVCTRSPRYSGHGKVGCPNFKTGPVPL